MSYNDGKWHGWNGGKCQLHPETLVEIVFMRDGVADVDTAIAKMCDWDENCDSPIIAFRVIKEHREPREWWINPICNDRSSTPIDGYVHVREVIDE